MMMPIGIRRSLPIIISYRHRVWKKSAVISVIHLDPNSGHLQSVIRTSSELLKTPAVVAVFFVFFWRVPLQIGKMYCWSWFLNCLSQGEPIMVLLDVHILYEFCVYIYYCVQTHIGTSDYIVICCSQPTSISTDKTFGSTYQWTFPWMSVLSWWPIP